MSCHTTLCLKQLDEALVFLFLFFFFELQRNLTVQNSHIYNLMTMTINFPCTRKSWTKLFWRNYNFTLQTPIIHPNHLQTCPASSLTEPQRHTVNWMGCGLSFSSDRNTEQMEPLTHSRRRHRGAIAKPAQPTEEAITT